MFKVLFLLFFLVMGYSVFGFTGRQENVRIIVKINISYKTKRTIIITKLTNN